MPRVLQPRRNPQTPTERPKPKPRAKCTAPRPPQIPSPPEGIGAELKNHASTTNATPACNLNPDSAENGLPRDVPTLPHSSFKSSGRLPDRDLSNLQLSEEGSDTRTSAVCFSHSDSAVPSIAS
ncbi:hypothetical protein BDD12DRAFT_289078 [Trichophaea hybrida]|nr:hypothetical protein BDD12DRAFT_289078 [Trichophaea hybrida]